ncbi:hypothetical protein H6F86_08470 [Phormidium sp. FACHB-592]|uniref:Uncharacterized protein n=1 Tax=Stenomitos frigidus AS-A4 TaxID=2933935 RepID=A0ABV0KUA0_9CYAN|nr:hypothetical protein [Phormidium sp. FACHB-592]MBD2073922.1 hypothetical protein [Phormidium sp. FACHB-592]
MLILTLDGIECKLTDFFVNGYEHNSADSADLSYSLNGTPLVDGILYEPKRVLMIGAFGTEADRVALLQIFQRSERKRCPQQAGFGIIVHNLISSVVEDIALTRVLATGAIEASLPGGGCEYFAQFEYQVFQPKVEESGNGFHTHLLKFVLKGMRIKTKVQAAHAPFS